MRGLAARLRKPLLKIDGIIESAGIFRDDDAFWVNGKEIAYFAGEDAIDIRLTRKLIATERDRLKEDARVKRRAKSSDWIVVRFSSEEDVRFALRLAELAAAAHRPPTGVPSRPPPSGADLARRRRFH